MASYPYPEHLHNQLGGKHLTKRKILRCSLQGNRWYENMVGQTIDLHVFGSFGAWDKKGRWISFYDISAPIK